MKRLIYISGILGLIFILCLSDHSDNGNVTGYLKNVIYTTQNTAPFIDEYLYDRNKLKKIISSRGEHSDYMYTNDLITEWNIFNADNTVKSNASLTYDRQDRLIGFERVFPNGYKEIFGFTYNTDHTISFTMQSGNSGYPVRPAYFGNYYLNPMGEIIKVESESNSNGYRQIDEYTYDSHNNPLHLIAGMNKISLVCGNGSCLHNVITKKRTISASQVTESLFEYRYNQNKYPTANHLKDPNRPSLNSKTQYVYY
jgi:hypothetical protein